MFFLDILKADFIKGFIRLTEDGFQKGWHERNGGNLSYRISIEEIDSVKENLKGNHQWTRIGVAVPELAGEYFLVTGSGKYMRNVILAPQDNIAIIKIDDQGLKYDVVWGLKNGGVPTSELSTHLANHSIKKQLSKGKNRVIYHAHTPNLMALTFVLPLEDKVFTRELWEMATENSIVFHQGIGVLPWMIAGSADIAEATASLMKKYDAVVWAYHGLFVAGNSLDEAFGLMDTIEKAAEIYSRVMSMGGKKHTITKENLLNLAESFSLKLPIEFLD